MERHSSNIGVLNGKGEMIMEYIGESSEDEMIALFLQTEAKSARYSEQIFSIVSDLNAPENILLDPHINSYEENVLRRSILSKFRGYGEDREIFEGFPKKVDWKWVNLTKGDLEKIRYIHYDYWIELSGGSRFAKDAAHNIRNGVEIFNVKNDGFFEGSRVALAGYSFPPMILVSDIEHEMMIVLEGHFRLTVYMLEPDTFPDMVRAMIGYVDKDEYIKWSLY